MATLQYAKVIETMQDFIESIIPLATHLADEAGEIIRPYFRQKFEVETKADASPVTIADRSVEERLRAIIEEKRPEDGIIGEEFGIIEGKNQYDWVFDPIDGTKSFIIGRPTFGTLIALCENGVPILGIIDQPILNERWIGAKDLPTTFNGQKVTTRSCKNLSDARLASTSPRQLHNSPPIPPVNGGGQKEMPPASGETLQSSLSANERGLCNPLSPQTRRFHNHLPPRAGRLCNPLPPRAGELCNHLPRKRGELCNPLSPQRGGTLQSSLSASEGNSTINTPPASGGTPQSSPPASGGIKGGESCYLWQKLQEASSIFIWGGDCYSYGLLANGGLDAVIETLLGTYDYAALPPIIEGAGGHMCDWNGNPLSIDSDGRTIAVGDIALKDQILEIVNS